MSNRILQVQVRDRSLDPAQAELWISVEAERITPTTELRGRLTGPRCLYAATVEVAYPLRPYLRPLTGRVVIPEPCLWEPQCPFLYHGSLELWEDGGRCDQAEVRRGLRRSLLGPTGLRVNGRSLSLRGRALADCDEARASALRRDGVNLLVVPAEAPAALWDLADSYGFFVLARLRDPDTASLARADHPSCFGWLLEPPFDRWQADFVKHLRLAGANVGVEFKVGDSPATRGASGLPSPEGINFVACPAGAADGMPGLPRLLLGGESDAPGAFGRVE